MDNEEWKLISDFPDYMISDLGRVMRITQSKGTSQAITYPGKILKAHKNGPGYLFVGLVKDGKSHLKEIHKLVTEAFLGPCPKGKEVNHKDGIRKHNELDNLEYLTRSENQRHAYNIGLRARGSEHWSAKLIESDIFEIIRMRKQGISQYRIADRFNVSRESIRDILLGRNWSWLTYITK